MADEVTKQARLDFLQAQTELMRADAALKVREWQHKVMGDANRTFHFPALIMPETVDTVLEVLRHWLDMSDDPITIAFNSPGGIVFDGLALYDFVVEANNNGAEINTTVYGKCASMAAVCLQAGATRSMHYNAHFMIHEVASFLDGPLQALKDHMEFTDQLQTRLETILVSRANPEKITVESLHERTKHNNWWMTAEEALEIGFIDFIAG